MADDPEARSHVRALLQRMRVVLVHTRYADSIDATMIEHGALSDLWWSRDSVVANFEACLANSGGCAGTSLSFHRVPTRRTVALSFYARNISSHTLTSHRSTTQAMSALATHSHTSGPSRPFRAASVRTVHRSMNSVVRAPTRSPNGCLGS